MRRRLGTIAACVAVLLALGPHRAHAGAPAPGDDGVAPDGRSAGAFLRRMLAVRTHPDLEWSDLADCSDAVERFYRKRGWDLAWLADGMPTPRAKAVVGALLAARSRGLDAEDYDAVRWADRLDRFGRHEAPPSPDDEARFDLALTVAAARYLTDLGTGRVRQGTVRWHLALRSNQEASIEELLVELVSGGDVEDTLASAEPPFPAYRRVRSVLAHYRQLADGEPMDTASIARATLEPGDRCPAIGKLVAFLRAVGDLSDAEAESVAPDGRYEGAVVEAVERFQRRHGLEPDGRLGRDTIRQLSTPFSRRVRQLELTLERWRWVPRSFGAPFVVVNIPEFRLYASDGLAHRLSMKVVVGRAYRWQTPVFAAPMTHLLFRPYWTVPRGIAVAELAPRIERGPGFLLEDGFDAVDRTGHVVSWRDRHELAAAVRSGSVRLRQRPGPRNALGGIKFVLPNQHDVYLHGTPARTLFARPRRDFSHGCIRLEDPVALARWILRDWPEWSAERIRASMESGATFRVPIGEPVPVLIVYGTAIVGEDGTVRFFDDVYRHDAELERALADRRVRTRGPRAVR